MNSIGLGTWPDWLAAVGTSLAFLVAGLAYARDVRTRREAQARLVYCKITRVMSCGAGLQLPLLMDDARMGFGDARTRMVQDDFGDAIEELLEPAVRLIVEIHNGSDELLPAAYVQPVDPSGHRRWEFRVGSGPVDPRSVAVVQLTCTNPAHPDQPSFAPRLAFLDAGGRWWLRQAAEPPSRVHPDPAGVLFGAGDRRTAAGNAVLLGISPSPEPKVTVTMRWHRLMRRLRRQPPIP